MDHPDPPTQANPTPNVRADHPCTQLSAILGMGYDLLVAPEN